MIGDGAEALSIRLRRERNDDAFAGFHVGDDGVPAVDDAPDVIALRASLEPGGVRWQDPTDGRVGAGPSGRAGTAAVVAADEATAMSASRYGIETELLQPFIPEVGVITIKATQTLWGDPGASHGDAMLGVFLRPSVSHDVVDTIDEYMASVGYRHYFWQGLHAEVQYLAGYVWGRDNLVDGKDYEGFVQLAEANIGYRFDFNAGSKRGFYVIPQFGYIQGLNEELIIGPRNGKDDAFWQGKLLVGYRF